MPRKKYSVEQIIHKLREVLVSTVVFSPAMD
jgi:hypothetical protein